MARISDEDLGVHKGRRRQIAFEVGDFALPTTDIAPGTTVGSSVLYAPGFVHFMGMFDVTATAGFPTTLDVRIRPRIVGNSVPSTDVYVVTTLTTLAIGTPERYPFAWGAARGLIAGIKTNYTFSEAFVVEIRNTGGANTAFNVSLVHLECS